MEVPKVIPYLNRTNIFQWYVVMCSSKNGYQKGHVSQGDWTPCSKYDNHFELNSEPNGEGSIKSFNEHKNLRY